MTEAPVKSSKLMKFERFMIWTMNDLHLYIDIIMMTLCWEYITQLKNIYYLNIKHENHKMYQKSDLRGVPKQDLRWQRFAIGICQNMGILAGNRGKDFLPDLYWLRTGENHVLCETLLCSFSLPKHPNLLIISTDDRLRNHCWFFVSKKIISPLKCW